MSRGGITEGIVEEAALDYFRALGYHTLPGPAIAPDSTTAERASYDQVVLTGRLREAARRINPDLSAGVAEQAVTQLLRAESQNVLTENARIHRLLTEGVPVEHRAADGSVRTALVWLIDWAQPDNNDWFTVNQFTVVREGKKRRPDIVVFVNGLPLGLLELKNPGDEHATLRGAWNQLQTYRTDIPAIFTPNAISVVSDGTSASMASFTAGWEHFAPWKMINEAVVADEVVDVYKLAGIQTPELSILSDEFLDGLAGKDRPNLQMGLLRRLLTDQIRSIQRTNVVQARKFSEQLDEAINRYTNRALTTAEIIAELVKLAKQVREQNTRHERLGLSVAEAAFYDAIVQNDAAVLEMGDDILKKIAVDLVFAVRDSVTIDWSLKESVRAAMRAKVRRLLAKYDYPPDYEDKAIELVLEQAELFALAA